MGSGYAVVKPQQTAKLLASSGKEGVARGSNWSHVTTQVSAEDR